MILIFKNSGPFFHFFLLSVLGLEPYYFSDTPYFVQKQDNPPPEIFDYVMLSLIWFCQNPQKSRESVILFMGMNSCRMESMFLQYLDFVCIYLPMLNSSFKLMISFIASSVLAIFYCMFVKSSFHIMQEMKYLAVRSNLFKIFYPYLFYLENFFLSISFIVDFQKQVSILRQSWLCNLKT